MKASFGIASYHSKKLHYKTPSGWTFWDEKKMKFRESRLLLKVSLVTAMISWLLQEVAYDEQPAVHLQVGIEVSSFVVNDVRSEEAPGSAARAVGLPCRKLCS